MKKLFWSALILIVIVGGSMVFLNKEPTKDDLYLTDFAKRQTLTQTVSETGIVKASHEIDLHFLNDGKIEAVLVQIGDKVIKDQELAYLDNTNLRLQEQEAIAQVEITQAQLNKLIKGASSTDIAVGTASVEQAESSYKNALNELENTKTTVAENKNQAQKTLNDLTKTTSKDVTTYEQAVTLAEINLTNTQNTYQQNINHKKESALKIIKNNIPTVNFALDKINQILDDDNLENILSAKNSLYLSETKTSYQENQQLYVQVEPQVKQATLDDNINILLEDTLELLNKTFQTLNLTYTVLENTVTATSLPEADLISHKTNINTQLTTISSSIISVQNAIQGLNDAILQYETNVTTSENNLIQSQVSLDNAILTARNNLNTTENNGSQQITIAESKVESSLKNWEFAKSQLAQIKAPARSEDIALQNAQIKKAQALLDNIRDAIGKTILKSPIEGIVTQIEYEIGERPTSTKPVITLLAESDLEIEVDISESDINKIHLNNPVSITLDAFGNDVKFTGKVVSIEPAETIIQDVIYYKIKIQFVKDEAMQTQIKPGMSADTTITTVSKKDVLSVPSRAVIDKNGDGKFIRILENNELIEIPIETGLHADDGLIEIISGLENGDEIVTYVKK